MYLLLVSSVLGLALGAFYLGVVIVMAHPSWMTLLLGLGLVATGISLIIFAIKFKLQRKQSTIVRGWLELKKEDQPVLFDFLDKLTQETKTAFPRKSISRPK